MNIKPGDKLPVKKYKSNTKKEDTLGLKPLYHYKEQLMHLNFDFTSLHEFLNNSRFVLNQHAKILNSLRKDVVMRCFIRDISNAFDAMARSYPMDAVLRSIESVNRIVNKLTPRRERSDSISKKHASGSKSRVSESQGFGMPTHLSPRGI